MKRNEIFLWIDLAVTGLSVFGIGHVLRQYADSLSFGGLVALFGMFLHALGFAVLVIEAVLLILSKARGSAKCAIAAYVLQITVGVPSTMLLLQDPQLFALLIVYTLVMLFGIAGVVIAYLDTLHKKQ